MTSDSYLTFVFVVADTQPQQGQHHCSKVCQTISKLVAIFWHQEGFAYCYFVRFLLRPGRGAEYCDQVVCLCVGVCAWLSVREHISGTAGPIFTKFCVQIARGRGSILCCRRCATLCTSGFVDDVTFGRNGLYGYASTWKAHPLPATASGVVIPGRGAVWCLWMPC